MAPALEMLPGQPALLALVVIGIIVAISATLLSVRGLHRLTAQSGRLLSLARAGRADEARIQARQGARDLAPILAALGGHLTAPGPRPLVRDLVAVAAVCAFPALVVAASWQASMRSDPGDRIAGLTASFIALAILLPTALTASTLVVTLGRRGARVVRAAAIQLLTKTVKAHADMELAEAARRSEPRDPRGD